MANLLVLCFLYTFISSIGYFSLGDCVANNILDTLIGPYAKAAEVLLLVHLLAAVPMIINPPNQQVESLFNIPPGKRKKRVEEPSL